MAQQASVAHQQPLPLAVAELVTEYQLGAITKVYSSVKAGMRSAMILLIIGAVFIISGFILGLFLYVVTRDMFPIYFSLALASPIGGLFITPGVYIMVTLRRLPGISLYVCTEGLLRMNGQQTEALCWDEVIEVRKMFGMSSGEGGVSYILKEYCLQRREKQEFIIKKDAWAWSVPPDAFFQSIEAYITPRLLPEVIARYEAGIPVNFGSVEVNEHGITLYNGWRTLPWTDLKQIKVHTGSISITKFGTNNRGEPWDSISLSGMPNPTVFVALLKNILGEKVVGQ